MTFLHFFRLAGITAVLATAFNAQADSFTSSVVQPIDSNGRNTVPPRSANANPRPLPSSTI